MRRAVSLALDRVTLLEGYVYGFGSAAWGPIPPDHPAAIPRDTLHQSLDSARALLADAGFDGDHPLAFELLTVTAGENPLEQMIQAQLAQIGVTVRLRPIEFGAFLARAQSADRDFDAIVTGIPGDLALSHLRGLLDSRQMDAPMQYAGYRNPALDAAMDAGRWDTVQDIIAAEHPLIFIYHARGVQGMNRRLMNVVMDLRGELPTIQQWEIWDDSP